MNYNFDHFLQDVDLELFDLIAKTSQDFPEYNWENDFQTKFPVADSAREAILQFGSISDLAVLDPDTICQSHS